MQWQEQTHNNYSMSKLPFEHSDNAFSKIKFNVGLMNPRHSRFF